MDNLPTITCPGCKQILMGGVQKCQFCGADVSKIAVPKVSAPQRAKIAAFETPKWVWVCYYLLAGWWTLSALVSMVLSISRYSNTDLAAMLPFVLFFDVLGLILGVGLFLKIKLIRKAMNWIAGFKILGGIRSLLYGGLYTAVSPQLGMFITISGILNILLGGFTIYLLAETSDNLWDD